MNTTPNIYEDEPHVTPLAEHLSAAPGAPAVASQPEQLALPGVPAAQELSDEERADVAALERLLEGGAMFSTAILRALPHFGEGDAGRRYLRHLAEHSSAILSYQGSPGYRLIKHCTAEEVQRGADALGHAIKVQLAKQVRLLNVAGLLRAAGKLAESAGITTGAR
jgi:hypothetical protein